MMHSGISAAVLCAGALGLLALPSTGFALGKARAPVVHSDVAIFTPASVDPRLARLVAESTSRDTVMRFTPAGAASSEGRSVTVAVRVDENANQLVSVHSAIAAGKDEAADSSIRVAPTRYALGVARGYRSFASAPVVASGLPKDLSSTPAIPDLANFAPSAASKDKPSRFAARISLQEQEKTGRLPRTLESLGDQTVDLGGSYRLTRNLDVTAGVRYSQDRDRVLPLTNVKQDSQAVYVGTQFRF